MRVKFRYLAAIFLITISLNSFIAADTNPITIVEFRTKVTEKNSVYWQYSWLVVAENTTNEPVKFVLYIQFLDNEGFELSKTLETGLVLGPKEKDSFTGTKLIKIDVAPNVSDSKLLVKIR